MATELYRDDFGVILHDEPKGVLELQWLEGSSGMTDDDFKEWLERYAQLGLEHRTPFMIIDVRQFRHQLSESTGPWRDEHIIPKYNAAGVKKFAFVFPEGAAPASEPAPEGPATFPTGYFDSRHRIEEWFVG